MRSRFYSHILILVAVTMMAAAIGLAAVLSIQAENSLTVYLSRLEEIEQFRPQQRAIIRFQSDQIREALQSPGDTGVERLVDSMSRAVGREVIVVRNAEEVYVSRLLRSREVSVDVDSLGVLSATITDPATGSRIELDVNPLVSLEITPFSPDEVNRTDTAHIYTVPNYLLEQNQGEQVFLTRTTRTIFLISGVAAGIVTLLLAFALRRILRPILELTSAAVSVRDGRSPPHVAPAGAREVDGLVRAFNDMAQTIQETDETRRRFLEDVAHELRGPLANLQSQIEAMQDGLMQPDSQGLHSLHEETLLLGRLVNDLVELREVGAGTLALRAEQIDLRQLAQDTIATMSSAFQARGVRVELLPVSGTPVPRIQADAHRITQVLTNLLRNALLYTQSGGTVQVVVESARLAGRPMVRLTVQDDGAGVPEDELGRIFDRFYRTDRSRSRESGGSGLGLAISRSIVEAHGGRIHAEQRAPAGLRVVIELPADRETRQ